MLKDLSVVADFDKGVAYINKSSRCPVRMYECSQSAQEHITSIKRDLMSLSAIEVMTNRSVTVPAGSTKSVDIRMSSLEAAQLEETYTFFTQDGCSCLVKAPDMVIKDDFPWSTEALRITLVNEGPTVILVPRGSVLGRLKPLVSKALAAKLNLPKTEEIHLLGPIGDVDPEEEENFLNSIIGEKMMN